jgi:outer membrane protein OmpA-like peptidoglycan-associated protein
MEKIEITGYADELGGSDFNILLSERRADVVKQIFVKNNVDTSIPIITYGKGYYEPMEELKDKHSIKNRRTEIKFINVEISDELNKELKVILNNENTILISKEANEK